MTGPGALRNISEKINSLLRGVLISTDGTSNNSSSASSTSHHILQQIFLSIVIPALNA